MKIVIYAHQFPPAKGGVPFSNYEIAKGLSNLGHEVHVIACRNEGSSRFLKEMAFPVYLLPKWPFAPMHCLSGVGLMNWLFLPFYFIMIKRIINKINPDLVFVLDETSNCFWGIWAWAIREPYVSYCSVPFSRFYKEKRKKTSWIKKRLSKRSIFISLFQASYKRAKLVICVSKSTKNEILKVFPKISSKLVVVGRSVDDNFFKLPLTPLNELKINGSKLSIRNKFVLLTVSRLSKDKGMDDVIKSLALLNHDQLDNFLYIIVGEGQAYDYLIQLTKELNVDNIVRFTGGISHNRLLPFYDACNVFILPSRRGISESFGRVFVEAAARHKPSIGVAAGGMIDVIENNDTGFLVPEGNVIEIKNKISFLLKHRNYGERMGINARKRAESLFTTKVISNKISFYLEKAINSFSV